MTAWRDRHAGPGEQGGSHQCVGTTRGPRSNARDDGLRKVTRLTWRIGAAGVVCSALIAAAFGHGASRSPADHARQDSAGPGHDRDPRAAAGRRAGCRPGDLGAPHDRAYRGGRGQDTFSVFGTTATLLVTDAAALPAARRLADAELAAVDLACSRFRPDSELSALNAAGGAVTGISELFAELLDEALRAARLTDGDVDPTCGQALAELGYDRDFGLLSLRERCHPAARPAASTISAARSGQSVPGWRSVQLDHRPPRATLPTGHSSTSAPPPRRWPRTAAPTLHRRRSSAAASWSASAATSRSRARPPAGGWRIRVTDDHAAGPGRGRARP